MLAQEFHTFTDASYKHPPLLQDDLAQGLDTLERGGEFRLFPVLLLRLTPDARALLCCARHLKTLTVDQCHPCEVRRLMFFQPLALSSGSPCCSNGVSRVRFSHSALRKVFISLMTIRRRHEFVLPLKIRRKKAHQC